MKRIKILIGLFQACMLLLMMTSANANSINVDDINQNNVPTTTDCQQRSCTACEEASQTDGHQYVNGVCAICGRKCEEHTGGEATCTEKAVCEICGLAYGETDPDNHDLEHHDEKKPICTEDGWEAYDVCKREGCGYTTFKSIPATGHLAAEVFPQLSPDCTHDGFTGRWVCTVCGEVTKESVPIPALGHTAVTDPAVEPTCTEAGKTEGSHCSVCGEVLTAQGEIPALGHWLGEWISDESGNHTAKCVRVCRYAQTAPCTMILLPREDPEAEEISFCPICGYCEGPAEILDAEGIEVLQGAAKGNLLARIVKVSEEEQYLVIAFEKNGELLLPEGEMIFSLPEELSEASFVTVDENGQAVLKIDWQQEETEPSQVMILRIQ